MESFTQLHIWRQGTELVKEIYTLTKKLPPEEKFGLTSQTRRAAVSILTNLAEGFSRRTAPDKAHKYTIARGECSETAALLLIMVHLGYLSDVEIENALKLADETGRLLSGLIHVHMDKDPTPHTLRP